jgi:hypothetical protein
MAATDASPIPVKNQAYRVTFPILDADGDLVTGATGLDSEISKDGGTFVDCTNEATEIATASGMYSLDITATEMNADTVAIIVKTTSSGAKTTPMILYPNKSGGLAVNVTAWAGTATATTNVALKNTLAKTTDVTGFNDLSAAQVNTECDTALVDVGLTTTVTGRIDAAVSTRATPAQVDTSLTTYGALKPTTAGRTLDVSTGGEAGLDWANVGSPTTTVNLSGTTISTSQTVASVSGAVGSVTGNVGGNVIGSVGSVTGAVGSVTGAVTVGTNNDKTGYALTSGERTSIATAIWNTLTSALTTVGSIGKLLVDNIDAKISSITGGGGGSDPWLTPLPGSYTAGTAGNILGNRLDVAVSTRATQTSVDTLATYVDTEVAAIKTKTDNLPADPASAGTINTSFSGVNTKLDTIDDFLDTEIAAIKAKTDQLIFDGNGHIHVSFDSADLNQIADAILKRDFTLLSGEAAYCLLNAVRMLRNKWDTAGGTLTVRKEDGTTTAWTRALSVDPTAQPIVGAS